MKVSIQRGLLLKGVQAVYKAVSTKDFMPILKGIKLEAAAEGLKFSGNNMEMGIECTVPAEIQSEGMIVVPGRLFVEMVRKLPDTTIEIETNDTSVVIRYYLSEMSLVGFAGDEFPAIPSIEGERISIDSLVYKAMIQKTIFAASVDESRPVFTGGLFEFENGELKIVVTDTYRLSYTKTEGLNAEGKWSAIIPVKALSEVQRLVPDEVVLDITLAKGQALFSFAGITVITRLIEGRYPNYRQVIPQEHETFITVKARDLADAVERASLLAKDGAVIKLEFSENQLTIMGNTEAGKVCEKLEMAQEGKGGCIAFNPKYFMDFLRVVDSEEIKLNLGGPTRAGLVEPVGVEDYRYLLLPVRAA